ncbi:MAG: hypothetical protein IKP65_05560 [Alphaproteobacteria bacterium]|nr:hypothetical protein [Alphaproteobacteria bacterium]
MKNIKYEISNFMTLDEFENYVKTEIDPNLKTSEDEDREGNKKYFLLILKGGKFDELIPCHIYTFKDLQLRPIDNEWSDYLELYNINEMKRAMQYEWGNGIEYYIALSENEKVVKK